MPINQELLGLMKERLTDLEDWLMSFPDDGKDAEYKELIEEAVLLRDTLKELENEA